MRYLVQNEDQGFEHCSTEAATIQEARKFRDNARRCGAKKISIYDREDGMRKVR